MMGDLIGVLVVFFVICLAFTSCAVDESKNPYSHLKGHTCVFLDAKVFVLRPFSSDMVVVLFSSGKNNIALKGKLLKDCYLEVKQ